jgi:hypothetical protein
MSGPHSSTPGNVSMKCYPHIPNNKHPYSDIQECKLCGRFRIVGLTPWAHWDRRVLAERKRIHDKW